MRITNDGTESTVLVTTGDALVRAGLRKLAVLDYAILVTPHPSASGMRGRLRADCGGLKPALYE